MFSKVCKIKEKKKTYYTNTEVEIIIFSTLLLFSTDSGSLIRPTLSAGMQWNSNIMVFDLAKEGDMPEKERRTLDV